MGMFTRHFGGLIVAGTTNGAISAVTFSQELESLPSPGSQISLTYSPVLEMETFTPAGGAKRLGNGKAQGVLPSQSGEILAERSIRNPRPL